MITAAITVDTITDEQIRDLIDHALRLCDFDLSSLAYDALGATRRDGTAVPTDEFVAARARCAEIINARQAKKADK